MKRLPPSLCAMLVIFYAISLNEGCATEMVDVQGGTLPVSSGLGGSRVNPFAISKFETTWREWKSVRTWAAANGYDIGNVGAGFSDQEPVFSVGWYDALKWCNARSQMEGLAPVYTVWGATYMTGEKVPDIKASSNGYRLPSEAEWEWAARGGTHSRGYAFSGSNKIEDVAWYCGNTKKHVRHVGKKAANELGLYDMTGNVFEWCWDGTSARRLHGGGFHSDSDFCKVTYRDIGHPGDFCCSAQGLRTVRSLVKPILPVVNSWRPSARELSKNILTFAEAKAAADKGDAYAQAVLSIYYDLGWRTEKDSRLAYWLADSSAAKGNPLGTYLLGKSYRSGSVIAYQNEGVELQKKAIAGLKQMPENPYAIEALGTLAIEGEIVPSDEKSGVSLLKKAADMGHAPAQFQYAIYAKDGKGIQKDDRVSAEYFSKAAASNYSPVISKAAASEETLRVNSPNNNEIRQTENRATLNDDKEAQLIKKAESGEFDQVKLGLMYQYGKGVKKDPVEAVKWFKKASDAGDQDGIFCLAEMYDWGTGVARDTTKALNMMLESAKKGNTIAMCRLGEKYYDGDGVDKNEVEARKWFSEADKAGNPSAKSQLRKLNAGEPPITKLRLMRGEYIIQE